MTEAEFWEEMSALLDKHDVLRHPFNVAWREGALSLTELREYASEYYHHVAFFPVYLRELAARLPDGELRKSVLDNLWIELGMRGDAVRADNLLWLDFAVGTGALPNDVFTRKPMPETMALIEMLLKLARSGAPADVLAAFYVYKLQGSRMVHENAKTLTRYGLDATACRYFTLHANVDVAQMMVWREQLQKALNASPNGIAQSIAAVERVSRALWRALDGISVKCGLKPSKPKSQLN